jgi:hypothetical protein
LASLFGFAQLDFPGPLPIADGRYLSRAEGDGAESVLVVQTLGAPPAQLRRRRRRPRAADPGAEPQPLPLTRVTAIRAFAPLATEEEAARWLQQACEAEEAVDSLLAEGLALLNRALHARALAGGEPSAEQNLSPERASGARIGFGSGEETARGSFSDAREVDAAGRGASRRQRREEELRPQERLAAILGGRERPDACETLLLRARADLDSGRAREAALQLRVGLEALALELAGALSDQGHRQDMEAIEERREQVEAAAGRALAAEPSAEQRGMIAEQLEVAERVLRRRRILQG